jgi:hypothetical protein|tara:strand:+ start:164 stop:562 length:399 start_codon:yes stop_codon:yes gene_type:complete
MNRFFTSQEVYEDRIAICKECTYYLWTGQCKKCLCFMKVKARIAPMSCPINKWNKTTEIEIPEELPKEIIEEVLAVYPNIKTGKAKNHEAKAKMIELWNTITGSNYNTGTNCGSCLSSCFDGIKKLYNKYKK